MINGGFRGCCSASSVFKTVYFATWLAVAIYSAQRPSDSRSHDEFVPGIADALSVDELWALREDARDMFYHGYDAYMSFGYPWDELKPLSCMGRRWDVRERGTLDDSLGGYALTLVDSLDMLALIGDYREFRHAVKLVDRDVDFDKDVVVSVFEATIRVIGGLLSAHLLASDPSYAIMPEYNDELLEKAYDLGWRLLPAFNTTTGLPVHRVHLQQGVLKGETTETCTAAAGTLVLEFGLLSRLTNEPVFERMARRALKSLWDRRSPLDLVGSNIDVATGVWKNPFAVIGAGVDSFFEYLLKAHIALDDPTLLEMFHTAKTAVNEHLNHVDVHMETNMLWGYGVSRQPFVSALQAFWPGLEALSGNPVNGTRQIRPLLQLWRRYQAMPEMFDIISMAPVHYAKDAPLRPELLESLYHVYCVTRHPSLLQAGAEILRALNKYSKVKCGYASIADVITKRLDDRMDSYFLAETTKYLFLLFDASLLPHGHLGLYPNPSKPSEASFPWRHARLQDTYDCSGVVVANVTVGNTTCEPGSGGDCVVLPEPGKLQQCVTNASAFTNELSYEAQLATVVRNNRSAVPALPFDPLKALFTTEGHILLLKPHWLQPPPSFADHAAFTKLRRRKPHHRHHANGSRIVEFPTQDTCHLKVDGWEDLFKVEKIHERSHSRVNLTDELAECPRWEVGVELGPTDLDVTSLQPLDHYLHASRDSILQRQLSASAKQQKQSSAKADMCPISGQTERATRPSDNIPISELKVQFNDATGRYEESAWTTSKPFDESAFVEELNKDIAKLRRARIAGVSLSCVGMLCNANIQLEQPHPVTIRVSHHHRVTDNGKMPSWVYAACPAHFGVVPPSQYALPPVLALASPLHACTPIQLSPGPTWVSTPTGPALRPVIALVSRGQCSFVDKARHAQVAGAGGVIIVDFQTQPSGYAMDPATFSLADDDTGHDVQLVATGLSAVAPPLAEQSTTSTPFVCSIGLRRADCTELSEPSINGCSCAHTVGLGVQASQIVDAASAPQFVLDDVTVEVLGPEGAGGPNVDPVSVNEAATLISNAMQRVSTKPNV